MGIEIADIPAADLSEQAEDEARFDARMEFLRESRRLKRAARHAVGLASQHLGAKRFRQDRYRDLMTRAAGAVLAWRTYTGDPTGPVVGVLS